MALPKAREARTYYHVAYQRMDDARFLLTGQRTTAAVYLAGYSVECILKSLILGRLVPTDRKTLLKEFRGQRAHDHGWLKNRYYETGGPRPPPEIARHFGLVATWSTELRYFAGQVPLKQATKFVSAADAILKWADGRL